VAKLKLAGNKKKRSSATPGGAVPCIVLVVLGLILMTLLFYGMLKSA
jgi:hypothetical protein